MGAVIHVAGFPLATSAVPVRLLRLVKGDVMAHASVPIPDGYQLLYSNPTYPGMSGGPVMNAKGELVGIHGRAEVDTSMSDERGIVVKTGTGQAVPISHYRQGASSSTDQADRTLPRSVDDRLVQARGLLGQKGREREVMALADQILVLGANAEALFSRALARQSLGDREGALDDYTKSLAVNSRSVAAYLGRANLRAEMGDRAQAMADYDAAIALSPGEARAYNNRALEKVRAGDRVGAENDWRQAIAVNPFYQPAFHNLATFRVESGDHEAAIVLWNRLIELNPADARAHYDRGLAKAMLGRLDEAIADWTITLKLQPGYGSALFNRGLAYERTGRKERACLDWQSAFRLGSLRAAEALARRCP